MELSRTLVVELAALTEALADPGVDLRQQVQHLAGTVGVAVSSFVGLRITVVVDGYPCTMTALDDTTSTPVVVGASVAVRLGPAPHLDTASTVVFYAATPGAFVDLAADAAAGAAGRDPGAVVLDVHLDDPDGARPTSGVTGFPEVAVINQAIGVLIGRGDTPELARAKLNTHAVNTGRSVGDTARAVLAATLPGQTDGSAR